VQVDFKAICTEQNAKLKSAILADIAVVAKAAKCTSYEIPKALYLDHVPFSVDNNILTPTMKLKRLEARNAYRQQIDAMISQTAKQLEPLDK
jgi:long-chain acyl-CoA synthetase